MTAYSTSNPAPVSAPASGSVNTSILASEENTSTALSGSQPKSWAMNDSVRAAVENRIDGYLNHGRPL